MANDPVRAQTESFYDDVTAALSRDCTENDYFGDSNELNSEIREIQSSGRKAVRRRQLAERVAFWRRSIIDEKVRELISAHFKGATGEEQRFLQDTIEADLDTVLDMKGLEGIGRIPKAESAPYLSELLRYGLQGIREHRQPVPRLDIGVGLETKVWQVRDPPPAPSIWRRMTVIVQEYYRPLTSIATVLIAVGILKMVHGQFQELVMSALLLIYVEVRANGDSTIYRLGTLLAKADAQHLELRRLIGSKPATGEERRVVALVQTELNSSFPRLTIQLYEFSVLRALGAGWIVLTLINSAEGP